MQILTKEARDLYTVVVLFALQCEMELHTYVWAGLNAQNMRERLHQDCTDKGGKSLGVMG